MNLQNLNQTQLIDIINQQQADIKVIKRVVLDVTDSLGVSTNGVFNPDMSITKIVKPVIKELTSIAVEAVKPDFMKSGKENKLEKSLTSLKDLAPLLVKYKDL